MSSVNISISCPNGQVLELSPLYLRDHCPCPECRHPDTKQRTIDTFAIPEDIAAMKIIRDDETGVTVIWANDNHESRYPWSWLQARNEEPSFPNRLSLWGSEIARHPPTVEYAEVMETERGVKEWTSLIREWGFCFVHGCPATGPATQELIERIAFIRHTHYGGFWQFTADLASKDSAYTSLALGAHTDNTYFTDPSGLQALHLLSHTEGSGGVSLLVDGFKAVEILREESPEAFETLCRIKIRGHASGNETVKLMTELAYPVLSTTTESPSTTTDRPVRQIRWNNDDRAALLARDPHDVARWYSAAKKWAQILQRPEVEYWQQLQPGTVLIFDNWRVLHGRSAFSGKREMCGGYINMDDFISRWKTLNIPEESIASSI